MLQQRVRNDWDYPTAPHPSTHQAGNGDAKTVVTNHVADPNASQTGALDFEPIEWRVREYSENETSEEEEVVAATSSLFRPRPKRKPDTSESVESIADRKQTRKRKRQERLEEEMTWNIGLAHFTAQRNAWTSARSNTASFRQPPANEAATGLGASNDLQPSGSLAVAEDATIILPVAPRLLPEHPVRARITTATYSEIYGKVILQGRTPTVPINLQDVINSLIQGWKEEGNWPPKPGPPEPSMGKKKDTNGSLRHPHLSKGASVVSKVFHGLTGGPNGSSPKKGQVG